jgi:hypothetical protein
MPKHATFVLTQLAFLLIFANFLAQVPYYLHLYYGRQALLTSIRNGVPLVTVFALFLLGYGLLMLRRRAGYWLMVLFLAMDFLFYLWNAVGGVRHGYGLFFQLSNSDITLRVIFSIGYLNFFASGLLLALLLSKPWQLLPSLSQSEQTKQTI